ncbi:hypothetical protein [Streptomyces sp. NPDC057280]|uniref:hypothetical protein n=1 Tax=Streptomyces sp. NPDC057280 TaxID=3346081 RepID=UPI0009A45CBD|nr:hypothetical protein B1R27_14790 [Streptomyces sp. GKU 895]
MRHRPRVPTMALARLTLASGRSVVLSELRLSSTYGDMPEGYPCKPLNESRIRALVHAAERDLPAAPVHLVPPPREYPHQYAGGFGPVEVLPSVACVGTFHSTALAPARDPDLYRSRLTIVWFQPTTDVPSDCDTTAALRDVAWDELARDYALQALPFTPG